MRGWRFTGRALSSGPMMVFWFAAAVLTTIIGVITGDPRVIFGLMAGGLIGALRSHQR